MRRSPLKVKILAKVPVSQWYRYFPNPEKAQIGGCQFIFDSAATDYDWVVVYNDLSKTPGAGISAAVERLACSQDNTLFVVAEPENVKRYPKAFTHQFRHVLTAQTPEALPHPGRIYSQPALTWFYGWGFDGTEDLGWDRIGGACPEKTELLSTVCSSKQQKHTLHHRRYEFTQEVKALIPQMEIYGHGVRAMGDKAEALDRFKYHVAIENYRGKHHWTEKLSDSFLGCCLPFYSGCTNLSDYFPDGSYVEIDIDNAEKTVALINKALQDGAYEKNISAIREARRLVLEEYNFFAVIAKIIEQNHSDATDRGAMLYNRSGIRLRKPLSTLPEVAIWEFKNLMARLK